jgi:RNA polymerase sigma factor (sigma-70 family)
MQQFNLGFYKKKGKLLRLTAAFPEMNDIYGNFPRLINNQDFYILLEECVQQQRAGQKRLYAVFYDYSISICMRYANNEDDAIEIMNDSYVKIFRELKKFQPQENNPIASFKGWIKKILVFTAIDHYRKNLKHQQVISETEDVLMTKATEDTQLDKLSYKEIMGCIQLLPPSYRTVFSLFVIDGFTHEEISKHLGIATGTSKSNLAKARMQLQKMLAGKQNSNEYERRAVI